MLQRFLLVAVLVSLASPAWTTPARRYEGAACKSRVATMRVRLEAAAAHQRASTDYAVEKGIVVAAPDPDLRQAPVSVRIAQVAGFAGEFCDTWQIGVSGRGKDTWVSGRNKVLKAVALVKKRSPKGAPIGLSIDHDVSLGSLTPLVTALARLGRLQLRVSVEGPRFPLDKKDAPTSALERLRSIDAAPRDTQARALFDAIHASYTCAGIRQAFEKVATDPAVDKGVEIAYQLPGSVEACGCAGVDVDTLELFVGDVLGEAPSYTDGWIELRVDAASTVVVQASNRRELAQGIAGIPHQQRIAGVALDLGRDPGQPPQALPAFCRSER